MVQPNYASTLSVNCVFLSVSISTAAASRWSSLCGSVRRTCLTSARGSTRNCVTAASATDWLDNGCLYWLTACLVTWYRQPVPACLKAFSSGSLYHKEPRPSVYQGALTACLPVWLSHCREVSHWDCFWLKSTIVCSCSQLFHNFYRELLTWPPTDPLRKRWTRNTHRSCCFPFLLASPVEFKQMAKQPPQNGCRWELWLNEHQGWDLIKLRPVWQRACWDELTEPAADPTWLREKLRLSQLWATSLDLCRNDIFQDLDWGFSLWPTR